MSAKPIPISKAKEVAKAYDYDQVIIYARKIGEDGMEHMTTYGKDKENCDAAAQIGDFLKYKIMGWNKKQILDELAELGQELDEDY